MLRLLKEKFELGLFENPYVDEAAAERIAGNAKFEQRADLALRKSIVLLRNDARSLPLKANTKVYFETYQRRTGAGPNAAPAPEANPSTVYTPESSQYAVQ